MNSIVPTQLVNIIFEVQPPVAIGTKNLRQGLPNHSRIKGLIYYRQVRQLIEKNPHALSFHRLHKREERVCVLLQKRVVKVGFVPFQDGSGDRPLDITRGSRTVENCLFSGIAQSPSVIER